MFQEFLPVFMGVFSSFDSWHGVLAKGKELRAKGISLTISLPFALGLLLIIEYFFPQIVNRSRLSLSSDLFCGGSCAEMIDRHGASDQFSGSRYSDSF